MGTSFWDVIYKAASSASAADVMTNLINWSIVAPRVEVGINHIQAIVGAVLFYGRAVDNKLLVTLNSIGTQQEVSTEATN